jgi:hypothetical protein
MHTCEACNTLQNSVHTWQLTQSDSITGTNQSVLFTKIITLETREPINTAFWSPSLKLSMTIHMPSVSPATWVSRLDRRSYKLHAIPSSQLQWTFSLPLSPSETSCGANSRRYSRTSQNQFNSITLAFKRVTT